MSKVIVDRGMSLDGFGAERRVFFAFSQVINRRRVKAA
jgi:hypothetical protein